MRTDLEIEKMLVISTVHLPKEDMDLLSKEPKLYPYTVLQTGYGVIIALVDGMVPPREQSLDFIQEVKLAKGLEDFSKDFIKILQVAQENKVNWINFDRDGSEYEDFKFHW